jgi:hypothetical protein
MPHVDAMAAVKRTELGKSNERNRSQFGGLKIINFHQSCGCTVKACLATLLYSQKKPFIYREIEYKLAPASFYFSFLLTKEQNDKIPQPDRVEGSHKVV